MSYSSHPSSFPFSELNLKIPSTNYHHTTTMTRISETSSNTTHVKAATIELQIQGWYKLYVEPFKGHPPINMENGYFVAPKFNYKFKVSLFNLTNTSFYYSHVAKELAKLPMSFGLIMYLHPHVVNKIIALAQMNLADEFKIVFDVKVVKIDLADNRQCDSYRRRGLIK